MNRQSLFITNGDCAAALISQAELNGHVLPWRDPMHHGPFPKCDTLSQCSQVRARYLAGDCLDLNTVQLEFLQRDATLQSHSDYSETVLWFEHDLLDQLQILQILSAIESPAELSMICINRFSGVEPFRGLGQLTVNQIASLYPSRQTITQAQRRQARDIWSLFCHNDPEPLSDFVRYNSIQFPFLERALIRHFQEYPWSSDGLTRTERQLLSLLEHNPSTPGHLFADNMLFEDALFIGDWRTFSVIDALARAARPLINTSSSDYQSWLPDSTTAEHYKSQQLQLTAAGRQLLNGAAHGSQMIQRDTWLGGVHIDSGDNNWLWDDSSRRLVRPSR